MVLEWPGPSREAGAGRRPINRYAKYSRGTPGPRGPPSPLFSQKPTLHPRKTRYHNPMPYPTEIDTLDTTHENQSSSVTEYIDASDINALARAVLAIQQTLGLNPAAAASDVAERLNDVETALGTTPETGDITSAITTHNADSTNVHGITDTAVLRTAAQEAAAIAAHEADTSSVHGIADTSVLRTASQEAAAIAAHEADTTAIHGISDTSKLGIVNNHGATASQARISGLINIWVGSVEPTNMANGDIWVKTV